VIATSWGRKQQSRYQESDSLIVKDRPPDSTNPGSAVGAIEAFDATVGSGSRLVEVGKALEDTSCSSPINQDVKGI
jgi:hypothetical protein